MAASIVLSGGDLSELSFPMGLALVAFVLAFVGGVLLLHFLDWSTRLRRPGIWTLFLMVALRGTHRDEAEEPGVLVPMTSVPLTVLAIAARLAHMTFVVGGFALVIWGFALAV